MSSVFSIPPQNLGHFFSKSTETPEEISETVTAVDTPVIGGSVYQMLYEQDRVHRTPRQLTFMTKEKSRSVLLRFKVESTPQGEQKVVFMPGNCHASTHLENMAKIITMIKEASA